MNHRPLNRTLLLLAGALWGCPEAPPPPPPPPPLVEQVRKEAARLEDVQGSVILERDAKPRHATNEPLFAKDVIETREAASAVLRFPGDQLVELGSEGRFEIGDDGAGMLLTIVRGLVLTRVPVRRPEVPDAEALVSLVISTPFGITRVGGASVQIDVGQVGADVDVRVGAIELVSRTGEVTRMVAGGRMTLGAIRQLPLTTIFVVAATGRAEYKPQTGKGFVPLNARRLPKLAAGDTVRVKAGEVTLSAEGSAARVTLDRGAEAVLLESRRGEGAEDTGLELKKGGFRVTAPGDQETRVRVGGGLALASRQAQWALRRTRQGFEVDSWAGDLRLEREGLEAVVVPGGRSAVLHDREFNLRDAARESVSLPMRSGMRVFHSGLPKMTLSWDGPEGVDSWRVAVARDANFAQPLVDGVVHERFVSIPVPARGALYWRVSQGDKEHARGSAVFAPEKASGDLLRVRNEVPDGPETTTIYFQDKPPVLTFTWAKDESAARYRLLIYSEGQLSKAVASRVVTEDRVSLPEATLSEGKFLWSVTPLDDSDQELKGGRLNKLVLVYDNAVPELIIKSPREGERFEKSVDVSGTAPLGARVFVNGRAMALDDKARFSSSVLPLPGGKVVFRLVHGNAESYTIRTVRMR